MFNESHYRYSKCISFVINACIDKGLDVLNNLNDSSYNYTFSPSSVSRPFASLSNESFHEALQDPGNVAYDRPITTRSGDKAACGFGWLLAETRYHERDLSACCGLANGDLVGEARSLTSQQLASQSSTFCAHLLLSLVRGALLDDERHLGISNLIH